jgi:hypothetical protein
MTRITLNIPGYKQPIIISTDSLNVLTTQDNDAVDIDAFFKQWDDLNKEYDIVEEECKKVDALVKIYYEKYSTEGFSDRLKEMAAVAINAIIEFFKKLAEFVKNIIKWITHFIKSKAYLNVFLYISSLISHDGLAEAYDKYGNTNILEEIEGIPPLRSSAIESIGYMKYDLKSFDNYIERISVLADVAVKNIKDVMEITLKEGVWLRVGGAEYGDPDQEYNTLSDKRSKLEFYNERNFQEFMYKLNILTNGSFNNIIKDKDTSRGNGIYARFDFSQYDGTISAMAVILRKKLDEVSDAIQKNKNLNNIPINIVISKELIIKIRNKDTAIIKRIENDANIAIKNCEIVGDISIKFYNKLREIKEQNKTAAGNFTGLQESQQWMKFMVDFTKYFFNHRLNTLDVARRATAILYKKANLNPNKSKVVRINSNLGNILFIEKETFRKLPTHMLYKLSYDIMRRHLAKLSGTGSIPVFLVIMKNDHISISEDESLAEIGNALGLYSGVSDVLVSKIIAMCSTPITNDKVAIDLINQYDKIVDNEKYTSPDEECKLKGIIIRISYDDVLNTLPNIEEIDNYFSTFFFGTIIHEATHARQIYEIEKTLTESKDGEFGNTEADKKNYSIRERKIVRRESKLMNNDRLKQIQKMHEIYMNNKTGYEREANEEQSHFIMSIISKICKDSNVIDKIGKTLYKNI